MKVLLDTHAFIWAIGQPLLLSGRATATIEDPANTILISSASAYEIEFKRRRDPLLQALPANLADAVEGTGFEWLPLTALHAIAAGRLPRYAGDPFDRMLAAQALIEQATILTRDPIMAAYGAVAAW